MDFAHGMDHTLYVQTDGSLWVTGDNAYGQLGDGSTTDRNSSYRIVDANVTAVAAGMHHSMFLKRDGSLWVMGRNDYGQLGNGNGLQQTTPQNIVVAGVVSIAAGGHHTCFVKTDGSLWSSGLNANGQLGNDFTNNLITPALSNTREYRQLRPEKAILFTSRRTVPCGRWVAMPTGNCETATTQTKAPALKLSTST